MKIVSLATAGFLLALAVPKASADQNRELKSSKGSKGGSDAGDALPGNYYGQYQFYSFANDALYPSAFYIKITRKTKDVFLFKECWGAETVGAGNQYAASTLTTTKVKGKMTDFHVQKQQQPLDDLSTASFFTGHIQSSKKKKDPKMQITFHSFFYGDTFTAYPTKIKQIDLDEETGCPCEDITADGCENPLWDPTYFDMMEH